MLFPYFGIILKIKQFPCTHKLWTNESWFSSNNVKNRYDNGGTDIFTTHIKKLLSLVWETDPYILLKLVQSKNQAVDK